jgi:uncharacterized protein with ATP-grasp and redox domains
LKTYLDCYPCALNQALRAARLSKADENQQLFILKQTLSLLQDLPSGTNPPEIGYRVHQIVRELLGASDPYFAAKKESTRQALGLYPRLKELVERSDDPFEAAIRISIAGNIIDYAVKDEIDDLWQTVERVFQQPFAVDDSPKFRADLRRTGHILYLADNAGETVFDRVLIETIGLPVIYAVKEGPILNDALIEDAEDAHLDDCATLITNGTRATGTIFDLCSPEFLREFEQAPLVIAKGQANYETLSDAGEKVYCLLQVKCPVIGTDVGAPAGSIVIRQSAKGR